MNARRARTILSLALICAVSLASCGKKQDSTVRMAYPPIVASLPLFIAEDRQSFREKGVILDKKSFASSNDMVNAIVAGQVDVLPAVSLIPIIQLEIQYPGRVRIFSHSRMRSTNAFDSVIVKDSSGVRKLEDLNGKKVGVFPGTSAMNMFKAFLKKHNVAPQTVSFVQLAPPAQLSSLESGAVDALFTYEPVTTAAARKGGYRTIFGSVYADLLDPCPIGASVVSRDFERKNPAAASEAVSVVDQAVVFMREHPAEAKKLLPKFTELAPEIADSVNVVDVTLSNEVDEANLQKFIDLLFEIGEIPQRIEARRLIEPTR